MTFRIQLLFIYTALCLLSIYNANAFKLFNSAKVQPRILGFSWSNCGPATDIDEVKSLTITPDPIQIPGTLTVSTSVNVTSAIPTDTALTILMETKVAGFWIKIPCVDSVGSCNYTDICSSWADICPTYFEKYGIPCTCSIPPKTYTVSDFAIDISGGIPVALKGDVRITGNFISQSAGHLACVQVEVTIQS